jgi:hypothetical protein
LAPCWQEAAGEGLRDRVGVAGDVALEAPILSKHGREVRVPAARITGQRGRGSRTGILGREGRSERANRQRLTRLVCRSACCLNRAKGEKSRGKVR